MNQNKITGKEKAAFAVANAGNIPVQLLLSSYLLIFYTNVVGLDPAAVGILFLIARVLDGLNDPIVGFIIDHRKPSKLGKFRPTLMIGAVLVAINYILLWFGPYWIPAAKLAVAYVTYLLIGVLFPVMDISLNSLLPVMTSDMKERTSLSTIKGLVYNFFATILGVVAPLILGDPNRIDGYYYLIFGTTVLILAFSITGALGVKERVHAVDTAKGSGYKFTDLFRIFAQKPVLITITAVLTYQVGTMFCSAVNAYYFTYVLGNLKLLSIAGLVQMGALLCTISVSGKIIAKVGKKTTFIAGLLIFGGSTALRILAPANTVFIMVLIVGMGVGTGLVGPLIYSIHADNTDYIELKMGYRAEAAIASLSSFVSKCAMGIGGAVPGFILSFIGFDAAAQTQSESVISSLASATAFVPLIFCIISAVIMLQYPLTKEKLAEQNEKIDKLRKNS